MPRALLGVGSIAANEREFLWEYRQSISKQLYGWTYGNQEPSLGVGLWSSKPSTSRIPPDLITSHHSSKSTKWDSFHAGQRGPDGSAGSVCSSALLPGSPRSLTQRQAALSEALRTRAGACLKVPPGTSPERRAPCSSAAISTHVSVVHI